MENTAVFSGRDCVCPNQDTRVGNCPVHGDRVSFGVSVPHRPVTMAMADRLEARGAFDMAEIARKYAIDRLRWWHRFTRRGE